MLSGGMFGISGYDALGDDWYHDNLYISGQKFECERKRDSNEAKCEKLYKLSGSGGWDAIKKGLPSLVVEKAEAMMANHKYWPDKSKVTVYPRTGIGLLDVQSVNRLWLIWAPDAPAGTGAIPLTQLKSVGIVVRKMNDTSFLSSIGTTFSLIPKIPGYVVQIGVAVATTALDTFKKALDAVLNNACPAAKSPIGQMGTAMLAAANPSVALMQTQAQAIIGRLCPDPTPPPAPAPNYLPYLIVGGAVVAALLLTSSPKSSTPSSSAHKKA
jgi:hypothetical protein